MIFIGVAVLWVIVGAVFGFPRACARYGEDIDLGLHVIEASLGALAELVKWTLLGFISGITFLAGFLYNFVHANEEDFKKISPALWSMIIFILGILALESEIKKDSE